MSNGSEDVKKQIKSNGNEDTKEDDKNQIKITLDEGWWQIIIYSLIFLVVSSILLIIIAANVAYETGSQITKDDFTNLETYHSELETALKETGVAGNKENADLVIETSETIRNLVNSLPPVPPTENPKREELIKSLNGISSRLLTLKGQLDGEQKVAVAKLDKMNTQIKSLKEKAKADRDVGRVIANIATYFGNTTVALAYPLLILAIILIFAFSKKGAIRLGGFISQFKSVKFFSTEFVLNEATKLKAEETLDVYRTQVMSRYDLFVQKNSINQIFNNVSEQFVEYINNHLSGSNKKLEDFRCTLHVPDLLFAETFYQLLDYYTDRKSGKTHGRTWSFRFGIIGKVWRSRFSEVTEQVPTDTDKLIQEWGMTDEEAKRAGKGRQSFFCVLIKNENGVVVGMFYLDAKDKFAFTGISNDKEDVKKDLADNFERTLEKNVDDEYTRYISSPPLSSPPFNINNEAQLKKWIKERLKDEFDKNLDNKIEDEIKIRDAARAAVKADLEAEIGRLCNEKKLDALLAKMKEELGGQALLIRIYNEY
jgi:hypothetical protein